MSNILLFEKFLEKYHAPLYCAKKKFIAIETFKEDIIKGNIFGGDNKKFDIRKGKHYTTNKYGKNNIVGVSLTRNQNLRFNPQTEAASDIQFTLDSNKLRNKYRIIPFDYYGKETYGIESPAKKTESEELLVGDINNASKYITNIEFNSGTIYNFSTEAEKINFLWAVGTYLMQHPHIKVSSVSYFGKPNDVITRKFFIKWVEKIKSGDLRDIPLTAPDFTKDVSIAKTLVNPLT